MREMDKIGEWFFENKRICSNPVDLMINEECYVVDPTIIDNENDTYAFIPCVVVRIDDSPRIPGRRYYMFQAKDSINDVQLNSQEEAGIKFYKYLENTSPYIIKLNEIVDGMDTFINNYMQQ